VALIERLEKPLPEKELRPGGPKRIAREIRESELRISASLAQLRGMTTDTPAQTARL